MAIRFPMPVCESDGAQLSARCEVFACPAMFSASHPRGSQGQAHLAALGDGTIVALLVCMFEAFPTTATMSCPVCGRPVEPAPDRTLGGRVVQLPALRPRVVRAHSEWTAGYVIAGRGLRAEHHAQGEIVTRQCQSAMTPPNRVTIVDDTNRKCIYWHRELPPLEAEMIGEHVLEAMSSRVPGSLAHRGELWIAPTTS